MYSYPPSPLEDADFPASFQDQNLALLAQIAGGTGGPPIVTESIPFYDQATGLPVYHVTFSDGTTGWFTDGAGTTAAPTPDISSSSEDFEILAVRKIDDVAGDQSGDLINYTEIRAVDEATGVTTLLSTLTEDLSAPYAIVGTPRNESEIGVAAKTGVFTQIVSGAWTVPPLTESFGYIVITVSDPATPPTFTDSDGVVTPLYAGESLNFSLADGTHEIAQPNITITAGAGDTVKVFGTKYTA